MKELILDYHTKWRAKCDNVKFKISYILLPKPKRIFSVFTKKQKINFKVKTNKKTTRITCKMAINKQNMSLTSSIFF